MLNHLVARARSLFPFGITARLTISFVAVAALAAAGNLLAQKTASVVYLPISGSAPVPVRHEPSPPIVAPPSVPEPANAGVSAAELSAAVDRYEHAVQARAASESQANELELRMAREHMAGAAQQDPAHRLELRPFMEAGTDLVRAQDLRRHSRAELSSLIQDMTQRVQKSLDGAWTIFGRVLARQSLLQLRAGLDAIRQRSEAVVDSDDATPSALDALAMAEHDFDDRLTVNAAHLRKSEGAEWADRMRADFDRSREARAELRSANEQIHACAKHFERAHVGVLAAIHKVNTAHAPAAVPMAPPVITPASTGMMLSAASRPMAPVAMSRPDADVRTTLAGITAAVMLLVALISMATIRSVIVPVKHILRGARAIADGGTDVRIQRGGIRELDKLAGAFNNMAEKLGAARLASRSHQESLEAKVLERTHQLQKLAEQDPLTSLPNRRRLGHMLDAAMKRAAGRNGRIGVLFIDIDNFKNFNDSLGHAFGDRLLMSVANRLEESIDGSGTVARQGGDEFTIVCEDVASAEAVFAIAKRTVESFHAFLSVDDRELSVKISVGVSVFPDHGQDPENILRAADSALFQAKEEGRNRAAMFTPELIESASQRLALEQNLRRALRGGEFELFYQPEVDLTNMQVGLVEALLRWRTPDGRVVRPGEFIPTAERCGLMPEINDWVLRRAAADVGVWRHGEWPEARVAVNISATQLVDHHFIAQLTALLVQHDVPADALEIELTETVIQTSAVTVNTLQELRTRGFAIALDDFGTGFSSLTSLEQLPLSRIKLDRSLIACIDTSTRSAAIARTVIDLCAHLGLEVTAEGVERASQFEWLLGSESMTVQGFLLSDAVPFSEVARLRPVMAAKAQELLLTCFPANLPDPQIYALTGGGLTSSKAHAG